VDLTGGIHMSDTSLFKKNRIFYMISDEDDFYMKVVALDKIYNILVLRYSIGHSQNGQKII